MLRLFPAAFSLFGLLTTSCSAAPAGDKPDPAPAPFETQEIAAFDEPWAIAIDQGTGILFVTEKKGTIRFRDQRGKIGTVTGIPVVDYGGQGGLGDFIIAPGKADTLLDRRTVYLSWVEAGENDTRGAAAGRADMVCEQADSCELRNLTVIWRQTPKVTGRGHFSHRIAVSPDGKHLFIASGDRQKMQPAQDTASDLGKILRIPIDANGKPSGPTEQFSLGHRNILGLGFDPKGQLWELEHGPAGGDELNRVERGANYGWPVVSEGDHYDGRAIAPHSTRPDLVAPALSWNPVIAPGGMIFYTGELFPAWKGNLLIAAMKPAGLVRVEITGNTAREVARYATPHRIRSIAQSPDGAILIVEDGKGLTRSRLLRLTPQPGE